MNDKIDIEVVYALPTRQTLLKQQVATGTTVVDAIRASGILDKYPDLKIGLIESGLSGFGGGYG